MPTSVAPPLVLTIAGFDPTSGAGITADLKTFAANQCYGLACITALTVQDTHGTHGWEAVSSSLLKSQLETLLGDLKPRAAKIGMLGNKETVEAVAAALERHPIPWIVLDPVYQSSQGERLNDDAAWKHMIQRLCPLVSVLTPNLDEAERMSGVAIRQPADMLAAATRLHQLGMPYVVVTGGHLEKPVDLLYDGKESVSFAGDRVRSTNTHGTGCTFSSALAANLALGKQPADAVLQAKAYLTAALKMSYPIGDGFGPLNHLFRLQEAPSSRNVDPAPMIEHTTR